MELLALPFLLFVAVPPLALLPAAGFLLPLRGGRVEHGRAWLGLAGVAWIAYAVYECAVWVWSQDVVAPIRVDLLLIAPVLYLVTALGGWSVWQARDSD